MRPKDNVYGVPFIDIESTPPPSRCVFHAFSCIGRKLCGGEMNEGCMCNPRAPLNVCRPVSRGGILMRIPVQSRDLFSAGTCTERSPALNQAPGTIANSAKTALLRAGQSLISAGTGNNNEVVLDLRCSAHACGVNRERNGSTLLLYYC